jgi:hypothetical protein
MQEFCCTPKKYHTQKYITEQPKQNLENFQKYIFKSNYISS